MSKTEEMNLDVKESVLDRYSEGAKAVQPALCCPVDYDTNLLKMLPNEIIDRDYGCGDPSRYVQEGDVVLDLGSGGGKICYMAAQIVGEKGKVIGVDMNNDMLSLARSYQKEMAEKLGADLVDFRKGYIQDLALNVTEMEALIAKTPLKDLDGMDALESWKQKQRLETPLVDSDSVDIVVSNCVLNLVGEKDRIQMIDEIFRVLKPGGRVAISDIIADEDVPLHLKNDSELWSGCISGAFQEEAFLDAFLDAGFIAVAYDKWDQTPWQVVEGFEFRSATIVAYKPAGVSDAVSVDKGQALIYKGPFANVLDEFGREYPRGKRVAVSDDTFKTLMSAYEGQFIAVEPADGFIKKPFDLPQDSLRAASETKGGKHSIENDSGCCEVSPSSSACC